MYRLMIADDQSIECRALEHKIQTEFENIEVLPSARDGIDFLKKQKSSNRILPSWISICQD